MHLSNSIDDDDNSSSDLKWESMSVASEQSNMTRFDTIEDVSHAIGMLNLIIYTILRTLRAYIRCYAIIIELIVNKFFHRRM